MGSLYLYAYDQERDEKVSSICVDKLRVDKFTGFTTLLEKLPTLFCFIESNSFLMHRKPMVK